MMTWANIAIVSALMVTLKKSNPASMIMSLVMLSTSIFLAASIYSSSILWFALINYLMFLGGVLVMMMVLSSVSPNQKEVKNKSMSMFISLAVILSFVAPIAEFPQSYVKGAMITGFQSTLIVFTILMYFFGFTYVMTLKKGPLRESN